MPLLDDFDRNKQPLFSDRLLGQWKTISSLTVFLSVFGLVQTTILLFKGLESSEITGALGFAYGKNRLLSMLSNNSFILSILITLAAVALLYVYYSKLRFSLLIRRSITDDNQEAFVKAWRNLRNSFRVFGIYIIAAISLYTIFFGLLMASSGSEY
ncbi:MAG: hypothetical protein RL013_2257 [Bacteroidota bacterium]|jgi:hypothetical protein